MKCHIDTGQLLPPQYLRTLVWFAILTPSRTSLSLTWPGLIKLGNPDSAQVRLLPLCRELGSPPLKTGSFFGICRSTDRRASFIQLQHTGSHFFTFTCRVKSATMDTISSLMLPVSRSLAQLWMWLSSITTAPMGRATALCTSTLTSM